MENRRFTKTLLNPDHGGTSGCRAAQGSERCGQATVVRSFRIHMSLVSHVSHTLMDKCEFGQNTISLTAVKAFGDAHLKLYTMCYSLALITKGSVRTLVRSVE